MRTIIYKLTTFCTSLILFASTMTMAAPRHFRPTPPLIPSPQAFQQLQEASTKRASIFQIVLFHEALASTSTKKIWNAYIQAMKAWMDHPQIKNREDLQKIARTINEEIKEEIKNKQSTSVVMGHYIELLKKLPTAKKTIDQATLYKDELKKNSSSSISKETASAYSAFLDAYSEELQNSTIPALSNLAPDLEQISKEIKGGNTAYEETIPSLYQGFLNKYTSAIQAHSNHTPGTVSNESCSTSSNSSTNPLPLTNQNDVFNLNSDPKPPANLPNVTEQPAPAVQPQTGDQVPARDSANLPLFDSAAPKTSNAVYITLSNGGQCTGLYFRDGIILTAAHCFKEGEHFVARPTFVYFENPQPYDPSKRVKVSENSYEFHSSYRGSIHDIAWIKIPQKDIPKSYEKNKLEVATLHNITINTKFRAYGASDHSPAVLQFRKENLSQEEEKDIRSHIEDQNGPQPEQHNTPEEEFNEAFENARKGLQSMLHLVPVPANKKMRKGDSGGPLYVLENGKWKIAGVLQGKNINKRFHTFIRIEPYLDWIQKSVQSKFPDHPIGFTTNGESKPQAIKTKTQSANETATAQNQNTEIQDPKISEAAETVGNHVLELRSTLQALDPQDRGLPTCGNTCYANAANQLFFKLIENNSNNNIVFDSKNIQSNLMDGIPTDKLNDIKKDQLENIFNSMTEYLKATTGSSDFDIYGQLKGIQHAADEYLTRMLIDIFDKTLYNQLGGFRIANQLVFKDKDHYKNRLRLEKPRLILPPIDSHKKKTVSVQAMVKPNLIPTELTDPENLPRKENDKGEYRNPPERGEAQKFEFLYLEPTETTPKRLLIPFKRFDQEKAVRYPEEPKLQRLDTELTDFKTITIPYSLKSDLIKNNFNPKTHHPSKNLQMTLRGAVVHTGTLNSGHYVAYIFQKGKWYLYNNETAMEVLPEQAITQIAENGTILLYEDPTPRGKP